MDRYRFSMMNIQDSTEVDLDALLFELCALENQLKEENCMSQSNFFGQDTLRKHEARSENRPFLQQTDELSPIVDASTLPRKENQPSMFAEMSSRITAPLTLTNCQSRQINGKTDVTPLNNCQAVGRISAECILNSEANIQSKTKHGGNHSPDNDSAFCDNLSVMSIESLSLNGRSNQNNGSTVGQGVNNRKSIGLSVDSSNRGSMATPSPIQPHDVPSITDQFLDLSDNQTSTVTNCMSTIKAEKIRIALEKMKEASIRKLYIKIFTRDENSKSILIDERMTVANVLKLLAVKNHICLTPYHTLSEYNPDLYMERCYEDHEHLVENILMWSKDSKNKLYFFEKRSKVDPVILNMAQTSRIIPPQEGTLYLKQEGKKAWRKRNFFLRASGLYYSTKNKAKSSKDLICLTQLDPVQIYTGVEWKRKYKAPTNYGFALKHPQIQVKASKYIKYMCAEDELTYRHWMAALRISKSGSKIFENHRALESSIAAQIEGRVILPSLKSSTSLESLAYYKDSVVVRPKISYAQNACEDKVQTSPADGRLSIHRLNPSCDVTNSDKNLSKEFCNRRRIPSRSVSISRPLENPQIKHYANGCCRRSSQNSPAISHETNLSSDDRLSAANSASNLPANQPISKSFTESHSAANLSCSNGGPTLLLDSPNSADHSGKKSVMSTSFVRKGALLPLTEQTRHLHSVITDKTEIHDDSRYITGITPAPSLHDSSNYTTQNDDLSNSDDLIEADSDEECNYALASHEINDTVPNCEIRSGSVSTSVVCSDPMNAWDQSAETDFPPPPSPLPNPEPELSPLKYAISSPSMAALEALLHGCSKSVITLHSCAKHDSCTCTLSSLNNSVPDYCTCSCSMNSSSYRRTLSETDSLCTCGDHAPASSQSTSKRLDYVSPSKDETKNLLRSSSPICDDQFSVSQTSFPIESNHNKPIKPPPPLPPKRHDSTRLTVTNVGNQDVACFPSLVTNQQFPQNVTREPSCDYYAVFSSDSKISR